MIETLLILTFASAPAYALRFGLAGLPTNLLMVWLFIVIALFCVWIFYSKNLNSFFKSVLEIDNKILLAVCLFMVAGIISLFVGGYSLPKYGQFIVLFLQPISGFFILRFIFKKYPEAKAKLIFFFYIFVSVAGLLALIQYFTLIGLPAEFWGNSNEPKRAISFFTHPNGYSLFITPILAFLIPHLLERVKAIKEKPFFLIYPVMWGIGTIGLVLSLSRGGWLGLLAAAGVFLLFNFKKNYLIGATILIIVSAGIIYAVPNLRYRILLPFYGEKSSSARLSLWQTGTKMVIDSPILGKGLLGFSDNWYEFNRDPNLDHYPAPHNIFLNFWIDTGLLGLISFLMVSLVAFMTAIKKRKSVYPFGVALALVAMFVHGQIDIPYFKNDLALLYWFIISIL